MFSDLAQDVRYTARSLLRSPGFALVAILTLALGIGTNTAAFSIVNGVLLGDLPYREPAELVALGEGNRSGPNTELSTTSPGSFFDWKEGARSAFSGMAGYSLGRMTLTGEDEPRQLRYAAGVGDLLGVLGVRPLLGRPLTLSDEDPASTPVVVLSYQTWQSLFAGDAEALGRTLTLDGEARTVVGVMPPDYRFPDSTIDFWVPLRFGEAFKANRDQYFLNVVGRLAPGVTLEEGRSAMETVAAVLRSEHSLYNTDLRINVQPLRETIVAGVERQLWILMGAVAFVLLIACANLAGLLLARASHRRAEIGVRNALGASRGRLVRQLLTESLVLASLGGGAGLLLGVNLLDLLRVLPFTQPGNLPRAAEIGIDSRVLVFSLAVTILAGLFFGIAPALHASRHGAARALREGGWGGGGRARSRSGLVVAQVALAVMLLAGAGLLIRSFAALRNVDPGVRVERLLTFDFARQLPPSDAEPVARREENRRFFETTLEEIETVPGVRSAAVVGQLPITGRGVGAWFNILSRPLPTGTTPPAVPYRVVTPGYFRTAGIPLVRGRRLTRDDRLGGQAAVVINETLARRFWPDSDPIGEEIYLGAPDNRIVDRATIVGIVGDTRDGGLGADPFPTVYIPHGLAPYWRWFSYVVRTEVEPTSVADPVRSAIRALDRVTPIENLRTMEQVLDDSTASARWWTILLAAFAGLALALAALGVFGVLSYVVAQRAREMGIRMAMGATADNLRRMVVGQGMVLATSGALIGLAGGLALTRLMSGMLYGISHTDPLTYAGVLVVLLTIGALASYLPARRATRVNPVDVLKQM